MAGIEKQYMWLAVLNSLYVVSVAAEINSFINYSESKDFDDLCITTEKFAAKSTELSLAMQELLTNNPNMEMPECIGAYDDVMLQAFEVVVEKLHKLLLLQK